MTHDYYHVQEWNPKLGLMARELTARIHETAPEVEVLFMGAGALGLPGKNDIDLDLLCDQNDIERYAQILTTILGAPQEIKGDMAIWSHIREGIEIDCILSDPTAPNSHVPEQRTTFEKLKSSAELRDRYKQLKYECDGLPYKEYEVRKKAFLEQVASM